MLLKVIGKYVAMPAAGVGMLAAFGMFDAGKGAEGGGTAGLSSAESAGSGILAALDGPLQVARRIAVAGSAQIGIDPADLPDFLSGGGLPGGSGAALPGAGAVPTAERKTVAVPGADGADADGSRLLSGGGGWKSSRPPAPAE